MNFVICIVALFCSKLLCCLYCKSVTLTLSRFPGCYFFCILLIFDYNFHKQICEHTQSFLDISEKFPQSFFFSRQTRQKV